MIKLLSFCITILLILCVGLFFEIISLRDALKSLNEEIRRGEEMARSGVKLEKEQKRLKKEINYWEMRSRDRERKKTGTLEESSSERENLFELAYIGENNQMEIMGKMGVSPTPQDFQKTLEKISKGETGGLQDNPLTWLVMGIIADWFKSDRESLCQWATNLQDKDPVYGQALQGIVKEWPMEDTQGFSRFLDMIRVSDLRDSMIINAIYKLGETSPEFAASLAGKIKNESLLQQPIANITRSLFLKDPEKTLKWLDTISSPALKDVAIETYVYHVASGDMDKTKGVIAKISRESSRETAMTYLIKQAASKFPQKAADIINEYPEGQSKQNLIRCFTSSISDSHPEIAMQWADQIDDEPTRVDTMVHLSKVWIDKDMDSFTKWFKQAELSSLQREQMQKYYDNMMSLKRK